MGPEPVMAQVPRSAMVLGDNSQASVVIKWVLDWNGNGIKTLIYINLNVTEACNKCFAKPNFVSQIFQDIKLI